ncbi:benzoate/H(+) symporter BenE family transporter [Pseudomonas sp. KCJK8993]|uniref:benzoate/H(+) symporter BenE family transporter n=1 Tax=Pseudomonas sp. KCJK8993 TaxID=3344565 RepID=UPI00390634FF
MSFFKDLSLSTINAGFVTVLVGFTSSAVLVFQAAQSLGATPAQVGSWMLALCIGMGGAGIALSLRFKAPIAIAWSTSGAAILISASAGVSLQEATGAFIVCGVLTAVCGFSGGVERVVKRIPVEIAAGMLAGILLRFGLDAFAAMNSQFALVFPMLVAYLLARRLMSRYAVVIPLVVGICLAASKDMLNFKGIELNLALPEFVVPVFSLKTMVGVALPLFAVTMVSQNLPGLTVLRAAGYETPSSPLIGWIGIVTVVLAPFGAYALNLATITAAICSGREAHEDKKKRYIAAVAAGFFYLVVGIFGATVAALFAAFPQELILATAGLALIGTIGNGLATALQSEKYREPALVTFLATASGITILGIGSAFWGMLAGALAMLLLHACPGLKISLPSLFDRKSVKPEEELE